MARIHPYNPSVPAVMRILSNGSITVKESAEILQCSTKQIQTLQADFGIDKVVIYSGLDKKEAAIANAKRKELLTTLARRVKYDKEDLHELAKEHNIASRTLYRWLHSV